VVDFLAECRLPVPNPVNFLLTDENLSQWCGGRRPKPAFKSKQRKTRWNNQSRRSLNGNLLEVFNARDADIRRAAIDELWDKDGVFIDPGGVHEGVEKINAIVQLLFTQFEDYVFSVRGPGQSMHGVGRLPWSYGPADDPQRLTGTDVGVTKDGKLTALYVFIDSPSQK
jgi:hypothetical protein